MDYLSEQKMSKIKLLSNTSIITDLSEKKLKKLLFLNSRQFQETRLSQDVQNLNDLQNKLEILKKIYWIDLQTRSLLIQFSTINPNIKLFSYNTINYEFFPTGYIVKEVSFKPMIIFQDEWENPLIFIFKMVLIIFILYFVINEIIKLKKKGKKYFRSFETYLDLSIIVVFLTGLVFYLLRIYERKIVIESQNNPSKLNLEYLSVLNDSIKFAFAFCVSLSFLKLLKLISFNKQIHILITGLKVNFGKLVNFTLIFFIYYFICVQIFYLLYFDKHHGFSTLEKSMITAFNIILGQLEIEDVLLTNKIGFLIFLAFIIFILLVLLNIVISILNDSIKKGKIQNFDEKSDLIIRFMDILSNKIYNKQKKKCIKTNYLHSSKKIESVVNSFLIKVSKVTF